MCGGFICASIRKIRRGGRCMHRSIKFMAVISLLMVGGFTTGIRVAAQESISPRSLGLLSSLAGSTVRFRPILNNRVESWLFTPGKGGIVSFPTLRLELSGKNLRVSEYIWYEGVLQRTNAKNRPGRFVEIDEGKVIIEYQYYKDIYRTLTISKEGNIITTRSHFVGGLKGLLVETYYINPSPEQFASLSQGAQARAAYQAALLDPNSPESLEKRRRDRENLEEQLAYIQRDVELCRNDFDCEIAREVESSILAKLGRPNGYKEDLAAKRGAALVAGLGIVMAGAQANADRMADLRRRSAEEARLKSTPQSSSLSSGSSSYGAASDLASNTSSAPAGAFPPLPSGTGTPAQRQFWVSRCQGRARNNDPAAQGCEESFRMFAGASAPRSSPQAIEPSARAGVVTAGNQTFRSGGVVSSGQSYPTGADAPRNRDGLAASHCLKPSNRGRTYLFNSCSYPVTISYCVLAPNNAFTCGPIRQGLVSGGGSTGAQAGATVQLAHGAGDTNPNGTSDYRLRLFACRQTGAVSAFLTQADPPKGVCR